MIYLIRSGALCNYQNCVESLGGEAQPLLAETGISPEQLTEPDNLVSLEAVNQLLELSAQRLQRPDFGYQLSQQQTAGHLGVIGLLIQQCPTVRAAIGEMLKYYHVHNQGVTWELREEGGFAFLVRHQQLSADMPSRQLVDMALFTGLSLMRLFFGRNGRPKWVSFRRPEEEGERQLKKGLSQELRFDQEFDGFVFASCDLDTPLSGIDENLKHVLQQHIASLDVICAKNVCAQVSLLIKQTLGLRGCSIEGIADMLSMHKRTLQRQLADRGVTFKALLDDVRFDTAKRSLCETHTPLTLLAEQLGYAELSAFSRAFKARFGVSPAQWRKTHSN